MCFHALSPLPFGGRKPPLQLFLVPLPPRWWPMAPEPPKKDREKGTGSRWRWRKTNLPAPKNPQQSQPYDCRVWKPVPRSCPPRNKTYWGLGKLYHKCWDATANCCSKFRCIFEGTDSGSQWVWVNIGKWWSGVWSLELFSCPSIFASGVFWGHSLQEVGMYNFLLHGWCPNWWLKPQTCNQRSLKNRLKHQLMRMMSLALSGHRVQGSFEHRAFQEIATIPMGSFWSFIKLKST